MASVGVVTKPSSLLGGTVSFDDLRLSINALQSASLKLDLEKDKAKKEVYRLVREHQGRPGLIVPMLWVIQSSMLFLNPMKGNKYSYPVQRAVQRVRQVNKKLMALERGFLSEGGLPRRGWFKHLVVAPGEYLGYGATTLPALTEVITMSKNVSLAFSEAIRLRILFDKLPERMMQ